MISLRVLRETQAAASRKVAPELGRLLSTYQLIPSFKECEELHCFADDVEKAKLLPPPVPPPTKKYDIFDITKYRKVDERAVKAPSKLLKQPLSNLVEYLTEGLEDDLSKVRAIYRWVTCQPVDSMKIPNKEPSQSHTMFQLWRIKHRKGNYAQLISLLCRFAQLPCIIIHGKLKGSTYEVGEKLDEEQHYGEWNAVLVDGHWRFVNAYWGTCAEGGTEEEMWEVVDRGDGELKGDQQNRQLFYSCDENYFLTDPDQMVSTHLPSQPQWQLLANPVTEDDFTENAFLKDRFFNMNLKLKKPKKCVVMCESETELIFELPKEKSLNFDFQYLLFRMKSTQGNLPRYDRYVFLQRTNDDTLSIRVRSPVADTFRFELVGKDVTIRDKTYDYDWVAIYKVVFGKDNDSIEPFPESPIIGWGPGRAMMEFGLAPMSHFGGEIKNKDDGKIEVKFGTTSDRDWNKVKIHGELVKGGGESEVLPDHVIHRVENGDVVFNVNTPKSGEYALKLYAKGDRDREAKNICNYMISSEQKGENFAFPRGFQNGLGPKEAFNSLGLRALTHESGMIETDDEVLEISFEKTQDNVELSLSLTGNTIRPEMAKRLIEETVEGNIVTYKIRLPQTGNYGIKVMGNRGKGYENVYDYVVQYKKSLKKKSSKPTREAAPELPKPPVEPQVQRDPRITEYIQAMKRAIQDQNETDLELALDDLKNLGLASVKEEIQYGETELNVMRCRRELNEGTELKDMDALKSALQLTKTKNVENRLTEEVVRAKAMLDRLRNIARLMHAVLGLDQKTIAEIKGYQHPPPAVHHVMMASLLLLGHWEEETEDWRNVQIALGKMGKESIKRKIQELKVNDIPLDVALGARDLIRDFTLDQVRMVSAGGATFYIWVRGLTEEIEKRNAEIVHTVRPRTSQRRKEKTSLG
uniref:Uncharacterized protein LOC111135861 isoform X3 n=1 Tax=Crassostrea virginica TaxID=6565 RepID=A0A8B8EPY6_CRAVI|nr:uncharacterized protein LOC111135861 isoform X3 [Crassostrea virginica]